MKQLTEKEAIEFANSKKWKSMTYLEKASFQINQECLCMPFGVFQEAVEKTLDRSVWTHELGNKDSVELMKKQIAEIKN